MVQVDVFWSYGLSAGLALAGHRTIKAARSWWQNDVFTWTVLWTACLFAPSGLYLLWTSPGWETMFVARDFSSLPPWLVALFAVTNVTQGVLGFYVTARLIRADKWKAAVWQPIWSHAVMFAILIFGWDGTGYRRFFYAGTGPEWHAGVDYPITAFFTSPIFYALLILGVFFLPTYFGLVRHLVSSPADKR
jgi:hypothetical protein